MAAGSPVRVGGGARAAIRPAPLLGADTDAVLHQVLGLDSGVIGRLHDAGVVVGYRSIGSGSKRCVCFTTFQAPLSRYWRSWPNRRHSHGWRSSEVPHEGSPSVRGKGRPVSLFARGRETGDCHYAPRQTRWSAYWLWVGGRLVRLPTRKRPPIFATG